MIQSFVKAAVILVALAISACGSGTYEVRTPLEEPLRGKSVALDVRGTQTWLNLERGRIKYARWMKQLLTEDLRERDIQVVSRAGNETPTLFVELTRFDQGRFGEDGRCELEARLTSKQAEDHLFDITVHVIATRRGKHDRRVLGKPAVRSCAEALADYVAGIRP